MSASNPKGMVNEPCGVIRLRLMDFLGESIHGLECKITQSGKELGKAKTNEKGFLPVLRAKNPLEVFELWVKRFGANDYKKVGEIKGGKTERVVTVVSGRHKVVAETKPVEQKHVAKITVGGPYEKSGKAWVSRFPGSKDENTLASPFKENFKKFKAALEEAGITVRISATYRPPERSYLMYWAQEIADGRISPEKALPFVAAKPTDGPVNIDWGYHDENGKPDIEAAKKAAAEMRKAFGIKPGRPVGKPYSSNHNKFLAVDMTLTPAWGIGKTVMKANGESKELKSKEDLFDVGKGYNVIHWDLRPNKSAKKDDVHWSSTGG